MTKLLSRLKFAGVLITSLIISILLTHSKLIDIQKILLLGNDLQYNLIATSATIGGFLFTGISILISAIPNKRIERLWENHYLDNIYRSAFVGILANLLNILLALTLLFLTLDNKAIALCIRTEIIAVLCSLIFFGWCVFDLIFILTRMKSRHSNNT